VLIKACKACVRHVRLLIEVRYYHHAIELAFNVDVCSRESQAVKKQKALENSMDDLLDHVVEAAACFDLLLPLIQYLRTMRVRTIVTGALSLPVLAIYAHSEAHQQHVFAQSGSGDRHQHGHLPKPRVAIIGGGAAGTSSAFFLTHLATADPSLAVDIDLFEANDYIGGRSTVAYPYDNESYPAIELGASIFVPANKNLWKAAKHFNLTLQSMHGGDDEEADGMAIWNGEDFVYKEGSGYGWWNMAKLFWRYGTSPLTVKNAVSDTVARFLQLYGSEFQSNGPYETIREYSTTLGLDRLAFNSTKAYLKSLAVNELFIDELVAAATRVNYGQDPGQLQACRCSGPQR
jgi:hypothetical protein